MAPTPDFFRLNDYDFGEGTVPTVTYATLSQYIYGVASTATETFPLAANEPFNFLNVDLYAQDTWKVNSKLTWTVGIRDTFNSNPLNPHEQIARLSGSFDAVSHDVNQPPNSAIQTGLNHLFSSTPLAILQPRADGSGPQFASVVPGVPLYAHSPIPGVTQPGTIQWLNPNAFISSVDPSTGACKGGDSQQACQFGNLGRRNALRGPDFFWSDFYLTKWFPLTERLKLRVEAQFFDLFNRPNFGLPGNVFAAVPGKPSTQAGFGALTYTTSPPTGLLGVGLGGDSTPRMIAFQLRLEF